MFCCNWENDSQWRQRKNCLLWIVYLQWKDNCCINTTLFECHCLFKCLFVFMGLFTEIKQVSKKLTLWVIGFWLNSSIKSPCNTFNNEIIRHWISNSMWHVIHLSYPKLFKFISLLQQQFNLESQSHASTSMRDFKNHLSNYVVVISNRIKKI